MIICCLLFSLNTVAQEKETIDSVSTQESKPNLMERLHQVQQYLDTKAKAKVDPTYIEVPDKPWRVILRYKENAVDVDYSQSVDIPAYNEPYPLRLQAPDVLRFIAMKDSIEKYRYDDFFNPTKNLATTATTANGEVIVQTTPNKYHTVRKGETLSKIASKYGTTVSKLKSMNHLRSSSLRVGQRLLVRKGTTITKPAPVVAKDTLTTPKDSLALTPTDSTTVKKDTVQPVQPPKPAPSVITYTVKKGDTLSSIARKYGTTAAALAKYNHLRNENAIQIGQKLKIPR